MITGVPQLLTFDMTADGEEVWGYGLGCNGAIDVFVEPAAMAIETAATLRAAIEENRSAALVTIVESSDPAQVQPGSRLLMGADGTISGSLAPAIEADARAAAAEGLAIGASRIVELTGTGALVVRAFVEVARPPIRLVVCGAGHDAVPLVRQGAAMGWRVVVADVRRALLTHERFVEAHAFIDADPAAIAEAIDLDERTAVVLMSHNYLRDGEGLRSLAMAGIARLLYLGLLGPRGRTAKLLAELAADGVALTEADGERVHAPAGLDLGAEEPEEVATAIVAEILAVERGHRGRPLRESGGPIHNPAAQPPM
jgi:xanthine/CO dehydrogenase XdhC/CoxF family maturation factor